MKGLYETDATISPHPLASSINGPSYISFGYALLYYLLIPEAAYTITFASFEKRKRKVYKTSFSTYTYKDFPPTVFSYGVCNMKEGDYSYMLATPKKHYATNYIK